MKHFAKFVKNKQIRSRDEICKNLYVCSSLESLQNHKVICLENEAAKIVIPNERKKLHQFKSTRATWFVPLVVYFDTEALLMPMHTCSPATNASVQMKLEKNVPCGYAFVIIEHGIDKVLWYRIKRKPNCLEDFIQQLEEIAKDIYKRKQSHRVFRGQPSVPKESVKDCWICNKPFEEDQEKVLNHCH